MAESLGGDLVFGAIIDLSLRRNGPEFMFWKVFFRIVNTDWLREYERRTAIPRVTCIPWDFVDGVTPGASQGEQYQQAVQITTGIIASGALTRNDAMELRDHAESVLATREREHARYPVEPEQRIWAVHHQIIGLWKSLVAVLHDHTQ